jgi:Fe-Mn family superoxide dismutase
MKEFQRVKYKGNYSDFEKIFVDAKTMEIHQEKHHETYRVKLNEGLKDFDHNYETVEELLMNFKSIPENLQTVVRNHGGGLANHNLFFSIITPEKKELKDGELKSEIIKTFGSFEAFQTDFSGGAANRFGSGWSWLVVDKDGSLKSISLANQDSPLMEGQKPILGLDVWEHAYYLEYQNRRPDYITAFWNVIDWGKVEELYKEAKR